MSKEKIIYKIKNNDYRVRSWTFPLLFFCFAILLEMINFLTLGFDTVLPQYIVFDLAIISVFTGILCLIRVNSVAWVCVASFFLLIQVAMNITNATLYYVFGDVFSLSLLKLGKEGANAFKFEFINIPSIIFNVTVFVFFIVMICKFRKEVEVHEMTKQRKFTFVLTAFVALQAVGVSMFSSQMHNLNLNDAESANNATFSDQDLWDNMFLKSESLQRFGTYGFYVKHLGDYVFKSHKLSPEEEKLVTDSLKAGANTKAVSPYSGIAKGDNLIILMLESFDIFAIDPIYTPFLYKMRIGDYEGAQYMNSFYAKNKTNISEEISLLGHIANEKLFSTYYHGVGLETPFSLPNLMKNDGAESVNFFHGYEGTFYDRKNVNVALGFDNVYALEDCSLSPKTKEFGDWIMDSEIIDDFMDKFIPTDKRFFSYYTSISTHGPYDYDNPRIKENYEFVEAHYDEYCEFAKTVNLCMPTSKVETRKYKQFKAFSMDVDKMVANIFAELERKNLLDTTTVAMFADHNAYYSDMCFHIKGVIKDDYSNIEAVHLPCIYYNNSLPKMDNSTYCSTYDVYPTICDMFGFEYNSALTKGYSVFSDDIDKTVFVSSLTGMYNRNCYSNNIADVVKRRDDVTDQDVKDFQDILFNFYDKQKIIELIYRSNYFHDRDLAEF